MSETQNNLMDVPEVIKIRRLTDVRDRYDRWQDIDRPLATYLVLIQNIRIFFAQLLDIS